jgi:DNA repair protein RecO (recombination protein O)
MRDRIYRTEALILRRTDVGEADRVLLIATPRGKQRIVARGVRKTTSRLAGGVELFTHVTLLLAIGRNLDIVTQAHVLSALHGVRGSLERLSCAYYMAELYDALVQGELEQPAFFRLLVTALEALDSTNNSDLVLRAYELRMLHCAGYRPQLHRCVITQEPLGEHAHSFSPTLGGMLGPAQRHADRYAIELSLPAFKLLRFLQQQPFSALERLKISDAVRAEVAALLRVYLRQFLERDLKTIPFLAASQTAESPRGEANLP